MARHTVRQVARMTGFLLAMATAPAWAQTVYGEGCNPVPVGSDEAFQVNICRTHVACEIAYQAAAAGCTAKNFLKKVNNIFATKGTIETEDVEQAAKPDNADSMTPAMQTHATTMTKEQRAQKEADDHARQMRNTNAANDGPPWSPDMTVLPPDHKGGFIQLFQGSGNAKDGQGILIGNDGVEKGTFKDGKLQGEGEQITPDGTYRGGNYQDGQIAGKGFQFGEKDGKAFVTEGTFKADQPDGITTVTYDDKSSERVQWENGKIVARGPRAPAGKEPEDPKPLTDVELAIAGKQPTDYVIGNLNNEGTGTIERVRKDGTAQFEEYEDGKLVQVGVRAKKGDALAPQARPKPAPQIAYNAPPQPEESREDPNACNREWDVLFAALLPQNKYEYVPYAQNRDWHGYFMSEVVDGYPANEIKDRFPRMRAADLVKNRDFLVAMRDTYRAHASEESTNPVGWYHAHDPFIVCWAEVEIRRLDEAQSPRRNAPSAGPVAQQAAPPPRVAPPSSAVQPAQPAKDALIPHPMCKYNDGSGTVPRFQGEDCPSGSTLIIEYHDY